MFTLNLGNGEKYVIVSYNIVRQILSFFLNSIVCSSEHNGGMRGVVWSDTQLEGQCESIKCFNQTRNDLRGRNVNSD